jgi:hypothetical protein
MAKLPDSTLTAIFVLQRQLAEAIAQTTDTEWILIQTFGETEETIPEFEELQNVRERLTSAFSRTHILLLRILEAQPIASYAMLELMSQAIDRGQVNLTACNASVQEIRRNWSLS